MGQYDADMIAWPLFHVCCKEAFRSADFSILLSLRVKVCNFLTCDSVYILVIALSESVRWSLRGNSGDCPTLK